MVIASTNPMRTEKIRDDIELPIIDLSSASSERSQVAKLIVRACEEYGFFKVINHGVSDEIITRMDDEANEFFSKPLSEKQRAGPANPYGYGCKNIGLNGDTGELEYLILQTNSQFMSENSVYVSTDPSKFRYAVNGYVRAVRELACELLDLIVEGLLGNDDDDESANKFLSGLIRDDHHQISDSVLRLNHYPTPSDDDDGNSNNNKIGFGEHTDPQILTILRSNGVDGLQISPQDDVWVPVNPHPQSAFCVNVGDLLQVMSNGRLLSVRHRVVVNPYKAVARMSVSYFAAPSLNASISCIPGLGRSCLYRSFTWAEYKKAAYSRRLGDTNRLNLFKLHDQQPHTIS